MVQYQPAGRTSGEIAADVESAVLGGRVAAGDPLPTVRALASALGVSPATVAGAYRSLRGRGLAFGDGRRGTRIAPRPSLVAPHDTGSPAPDVPAGLLDLASGNPDPALLPDLGAALTAVARRPGEHVLYGTPRDDPELTALAREQLGRDGVDAARLAVVAGAMDGVERALAAHLRPGDRVAVEDPGYVAVLDLVAAMGFLPLPCPLDGEGLAPAGLDAALSRGARAVVLTPRAQNPTGAATSPARATALRAVLDGRPEVLVVEDDHAGPVAGPDAVFVGPGRRSWCVVRSVSKWLGPDLRLALVAGDDTTVGRLEGRLALGTGWVSHVLQQATAEAWRAATSGPEPLLQQAAATYARRRAALCAALAERGVQATAPSGLNVWVRVDEEAATVERMRQAGYVVRAGERYRIRSGPAVRVTTARLDEEQAPTVADAIAAAARTTRLIRSA